jgi:hypothetical protein
MLKTIVKYTNTDIYSSTNTNMDPWMDWEDLITSHYFLIA